MTQPTVWRFVGVVSSVVGFLCFGLSSSFPYMFGKWIWWKICVYGIFGIIICLVLLLAKERERQTSPWRRAHLAFSVFSIICVYTFFWDKVVKVKPDAYIVISSTAFAIMSFILSKLSHSGVEIDLVNFFCGNLIAQLVKIKLLLGIAGVGFSYSLFILRCSLDDLADPVLPLQETQPNPVLPVQNDHDDLAVDTQLEVEDDDDDNYGNTQPADEILARASRKNDPEKKTMVIHASLVGNTEMPPEDGFTWRKYGHKLGKKYPRGYFRCTHQKLYGCPAKKQVQRLNDNPSIFEVTYRGEHTCYMSSTAPSSFPQTQLLMDISNDMNQTTISPRLSTSSTSVSAGLSSANLNLQGGCDGGDSSGGGGAGPSTSKYVADYPVVDMADAMFNSGISSGHSMESLFPPAEDKWEQGEKKN